MQVHLQFTFENMQEAAVGLRNIASLFQSPPPSAESTAEDVTGQQDAAPETSTASSTEGATNLQKYAEKKIAEKASKARGRKPRAEKAPPVVETPEPAAPPAPAPAAAPEPVNPTTVTREVIEENIRALAGNAAKGIPAVRKVLKEFGAGKLSEVPADKYVELLLALQTEALA